MKQGPLFVKIKNWESTEMPFTTRILAAKYFTLVTPGSATRADVERKTLKIELTRSLENVLQICFATEFSPRVVSLKPVLTE